MKNPIEELLGKDKYVELKKFVFGTEAEAEQDTDETKEQEFEEEEEKEKTNYGTATLEDGTVIQWEGELAEGVAIMVMVEDGDPVPAPDGDHVVSDGTIVTTDNGIVTAITSAADEDAEAAALLQEIQSAFAAFQTETAEKIESLEGQLAEQLAFNKSIFESVEYLAKREEESENKKDKFNKASEGKTLFNSNAKAMLEKLKKGKKFNS